MRWVATSQVRMTTGGTAMGIAIGSHKSFVRLLVGLVIVLPRYAVAVAYEEPPQDTLADAKTRTARRGIEKMPLDWICGR